MIDPDLLHHLEAAATHDQITKRVVGAVIRDDHGHVLVVRRAADDFLGGLWELPSGTVDPGEDLLAALHREVHEETGLKIRPTQHLGTFDYRSGSGKATRQFTFAADCVAGSLQLDPAEHDAHEWTDPTAEQRVSDEVRHLLKALPSV